MNEAIQYWRKYSLSRRLPSQAGYGKLCVFSQFASSSTSEHSPYQKGVRYTFLMENVGKDCINYYWEFIIQGQPYLTLTHFHTSMFVYIYMSLSL